MAVGRLARSVITTANTNTLVYTVPSGVYATVNVSVLNSTGTPVIIRMGITNQSNNNPLSSEYLEHSFALSGNGGVLERTAIVCSPGERIVLWASVANAIVVRVTGFEDII